MRPVKIASSSEPAAEIASEIKQPARLLKKKNIGA
jgi:hypothetical protein